MSLSAVSVSEILKLFRITCRYFIRSQLINFSFWRYIDFLNLERNKQRLNQNIAFPCTCVKFATTATTEENNPKSTKTPEN